MAKQSKEGGLQCEGQYERNANCNQEECPGNGRMKVKSEYSTRHINSFFFPISNFIITPIISFEYVVPECNQNSDCPTEMRCENKKCLKGKC